MEKDELLKNIPKDTTVITDFIDGHGTFYSKIPISSNIFLEDETGFLYCKNSILGNIGIQKYLGKEIGLKDEDSEKVIEMVRDEESVFNEVSMSSFEGKPITLFHPKGKVNSKNYKKFIVGSIKDVKRDKENLASDIVLYDDYTIDKVQKGELKDLSLGYRAKVIQMADGRYKQTDIVINHLAIVEDGRAINAQIMDKNTIGKPIPYVQGTGELELEPKDFKDIFKDTVFVTKTNRNTQSVETYDDDTGETTVQEVNTFESKHSKYDMLKQQLIDSKTKIKGENQMEKERDFKYFISEVKELSAYPESDFRDKAYKALEDECMETLGVKLISFSDVKQSAIANSVGLRDSGKDLKEKDEDETKVLDIFAKDEQRFFEKLYRSMDKTETARKYANMIFHDVYTAMSEGRTL
jgi:hypothetical protein